MSVSRDNGSDDPRDEALNQKLLAMSPCWSPYDDNTPRSTWGGDPADVPAGGGVGFELNDIEVPDGYVAVIKSLRFHAGDVSDVGTSPGEYAELWVYDQDAGLGYGDADWTQRVADDDFLVHFRIGRGGQEDTASGTGSGYVDRDPPSLRWEPTDPFLSVDGDLSVAWEGDNIDNDNTGEWALFVEYDLMEIEDQDQYLELLMER